MLVKPAAIMRAKGPPRAPRARARRPKKRHHRHKGRAEGAASVLPRYSRRPIVACQSGGKFAAEGGRI